MEDSLQVPLCTKIARARRHAMISLEYGDIRGAISFQTEVWELKERQVREQATEFRKNVENYNKTYIS
jgi:hypothetical protein